MTNIFFSFRRFSISGKSTQSAAVVLTSPHHYVEHYGQPLPVQVKEALTFSDSKFILFQFSVTIR